MRKQIMEKICEYHILKGGLRQDIVNHAVYGNWVYNNKMHDKIF